MVVDEVRMSKCQQIDREVNSRMQEPPIQSYPALIDVDGQFYL